MKTALFALFVLLASSSLAQQSVPDIPFDSVPDFLKLPTGHELRRGRRAWR